MKTIYSMGKGKYITLDSYETHHKTRRSDVVVFLLASIIATITIAAVLGVDVTQFNTQSQQEQTNATR